MFQRKESIIKVITRSLVMFKSKVEQNNDSVNKVICL
jgi:hypothetical protein